MVNTPEQPPAERGHLPESLQMLAEYLELSLDSAASVVMMRHGSDVCSVYVGDPAGLPEDLRKQGTIPVRLGNEMLELTHSGANQMEIDGQAYRFFRSFAQVGDNAAVVFSTT